MKRAVSLLLLSLVLTAAAGAAEPAEAGGHGPNLDLWKWVNFAILAGVLGWGIGKGAPPFFRSRTEEIQRGISDAARMKQEAEARSAKMELRMASLQNEIDHLRAEARAEMAREGDRIRSEAGAQIARIQAHGEQEIQALARHAEQRLRAYSAQLALELAEQRIRSRMTPEAQSALVDGFIRQAGAGPQAPGVRP